MQAALRADTESPMDASSRTLHTMKRIGAVGNVDLFVLPELAPVGYSTDTFERFLPKVALLKDMYRLIDQGFATAAKELDAFISYGSIGWKSEQDGTESYTIQQKVVNRQGEIVAIYDKIHLCDYGDCSESDIFEAGSNGPVSFEIDKFKIGMLICSDMRYPMLSRELARDHRVDVLVQSAAFSRDESFYSWKSFRETRAVENSVYFVGVNYSGDKYGESCAIPPWVDEKHKPLALGPEDGFLIAKIRRTELDIVRSTMPFHRQMIAEAGSRTFSTGNSAMEVRVAPV